MVLRSIHDGGWAATNILHSTIVFLVGTIKRERKVHRLRSIHDGWRISAMIFVCAVQVMSWTFRSFEAEIVEEMVCSVICVNIHKAKIHRGAQCTQVHTESNEHMHYLNFTYFVNKRYMILYSPK